MLRQPYHIDSRALGTICPPPSELFDPWVTSTPGVAELECTYQFAMSGGPIVCPGGLRIATKTIDIRIDCRLKVPPHHDWNVRVNTAIKGFKKVMPFIPSVGSIKAHDLKIKIVAGKFDNNQTPRVIPPYI